MSTAADATDLSSQLLARVASHHRLGLHALGFFSGTDAKNMEAAAVEIEQMHAVYIAAWNAFGGPQVTTMDDARELAFLAEGDLDEQIKELTKQRDEAESRLQAVRAETVEACASIAKNFNAAGKPIAAAIRTLATTEGGK